MKVHAGFVFFSTDVYLKRGLIESSVSAQQANETISRCVCVFKMCVAVHRRQLFPVCTVVSLNNQQDAVVSRPKPPLLSCLGLCGHCPGFNHSPVPSLHRCVLRSPGSSCSSAVSPETPPSPEMQRGASTSAQDEQNPPARAKPARSDPGTVPKWLKLPGEQLKRPSRKHVCLFVCFCKAEEKNKALRLMKGRGKLLFDGFYPVVVDVHGAERLNKRWSVLETKTHQGCRWEDRIPQD